MAVTKREDRKFKFETLQLHVGQEQPDPATDARAVPIYQTTSYVFKNSAHAAARFELADAGNIYGRLTNSTQGVFEDRIAALEGGVAGLAVASGAAAIAYTIQALAGQGEHIVAQKTIYGGTSNLLAHTFTQYGITTTFVDAHNLQEVEDAIQENTKAIYLETLGNPNSDIPDIDAISAIAKKHGLPVVVDNTFGTPYLFRPIEHGADIVVHSATKFIGGHGTSLGGVIVDGGTYDWAKSGRYPWISEPNPSYHGVKFTEAAVPAAFVTYIRAILLRDTGATISPFNAFLLLQGTETLSLRIDRHNENTKKVVEFLQQHPAVEKVNPKMKETVEAAEIKEEGVEGCIIEGPISYDLAMDPASAPIKGYVSPVAGDADLLVVPDIVSGNIAAKTITVIGGGRTGGVVLGAKVPVLLVSRAASADDKYMSIVIAALVGSR